MKKFGFDFNKKKLYSKIFFKIFNRISYKINSKYLKLKVLKIHRIQVFNKNFL